MGLTDEKILEIYRDQGLDTEYIETDVIAFARLIQAEQREVDIEIMCVELDKSPNGVLAAKIRNQK